MFCEQESKIVSTSSWTVLGLETLDARQESRSGLLHEVAQDIIRTDNLLEQEINTALCR